MKKTRYALALIVAGACLLTLAPPAFATCTHLALPVFHGLGGRFVRCAEGPGLEGSIYALADPVGIVSINENTLAPMDVLCEAVPGTTDAGGACQPAAGTASDEVVTVQFDWGAGSSPSGCPNTTLSGDGTTPIAIKVRDNNGDTITVVTGFSSTFAGYLVDMAHQNDGLGLPLPIDCRPLAGSRAGSPVLRAVRDIDASTRELDLTVLTAQQNGIFSDCDPGSLGTTRFATCANAGRTAPGRGRVYTKIDLCSANPDGAFRQLSNGWNPAGPSNVPDPGTGELTISYDPSQLAGSCFIDPGGNQCLSPPTRVGAPCNVDADCDDTDVCTWVGASAILDTEVAGVCNPPDCLVASLGACTLFNNGTASTQKNWRCGVITSTNHCGRCVGGSNNQGRCSNNSQCPGVTGGCSAGDVDLCSRCSINPTPVDPPGTGLGCTDDFECPGVCTAGATGGSCSGLGDPACDIVPQTDGVVEGAFTVGGPAAAADRANLTLAKLDKKALVVEFTVSLEDRALSFDILAGGRVITDAPIPAERRGTYSVTIERKDLHGAKAVVVRTNLRGGATLLSAPLDIAKKTK